MFLTGGAILVVVIYVVAFQVYRPPGAPGSSADDRTLAYQVLFRNLPGGEQRIYRQMKEGFDEALRQRDQSGSWPAVETLASDGVPPFSPDAIDKSPLSWTRRQEGLVAEYIGLPAEGSMSPAFLLLLQEPDPGGGEDPNAGGVDEEHQLLADGRLLHVTYWKRSSRSIRPGLIVDPALDGWTQIRIGSPFQTQGVQ